MAETVALDPAQAALVQQLVAAGRFASPEAAVAAGVGLLLEREARDADLRSAWAEGAGSGDYRLVDDVLDEIDAELEKAGA
jgi:antitoxin ParD1/3/4